MLQCVKCVAACRSVLQCVKCVAACRSVLQSRVVPSAARYGLAVCCNVLQGAA